MDVEEQLDAGVLVVSPIGRLDSLTSPVLGARLDRLVENGTSRMVLDLGRVDFVSSAGLRVILAALKKARAAKGRFALCSVQPSVQEVLEISGFTVLLSIHPGRAAALEASA